MANEKKKKVSVVSARLASVTLAKPVKKTKKKVAKKPATRVRVAGGATVRKKTAKGTKKVARKKRATKLVRRLGDLERRASAAADRNAEEARRIIAEIRRLLERIEEDFHAVGGLLRRLSEKRFYSSLGYASFKALLRGEKLMAVATAYRLMAIADAYDPRQARRLGVRKAAQLLAYVEATPAADVANALAASNARIGDAKVHDMSVRDLSVATRRARATGKASEQPQAERHARRVAREVQKRLREEGAASAKARAERAGGAWTIVVRVDVGEAGVLG